MKFTNEAGLPEPIVAAVTFNDYKPGKSDISVTELIGPPRLAALRRQHDEELVEDASDRIYSLLGQAVHTILERAGSVGIREVRLYTELVNGWILGGKFDHFVLEPDGTLTDYKVMSIWEVMLGGINPEKEAQLNVYDWILAANGYKSSKLQIAGILRDWQKSKVGTEGYPRHQVVLLNVPKWNPAVQAKYINDRTELHERARAGDIPLCSDEERWAKATTYAIKAKKLKRALRVLESEEEALQWAYKTGNAQKHDARIVLNPGLTIEVRPGENTRCERYCPVSEFCDQFKAMKAEETAA